MAWLYAGGVSSILPDVRFGTVSLDQVTINNAHFKSLLLILFDRLCLFVFLIRHSQLANGHGLYNIAVY